MKDELIKDVCLNFLQDCKKKDIGKIGRSKIIDKILVNDNISLRELARILDISHSTLQDWYMYKDLSEDDYNKMKSAGISDVKIYRVLRNDKKEGNKIKALKLSAENKRDVDFSFNNYIYESNKMVKEYLRNLEDIKRNNGLISEMKEYINNLNRLVSKIERSNKI